MDKIKTRFAPSPTGWLHVGGARTALFNYLLAKQAGGTFLLRIEDTDRARHDESAVTKIIEDLRWLGIKWGEGVEVGGENGPYRQSERLDIYRKHFGQLLDAGLAYYSGETPEELDTMRVAARAEKRNFLYPRPDPLPTAEAAEKARAERLAQGLQNAEVLPKLNLAGVARVLAGARACVAVDTGLGHLAAALDVPTISLFGPTNPGLTGAYGKGQIHLASDFPCAPCLQKTCTYQPTADDLRRFDIKRESPLCFTRLNPERVANRLSTLLLAEELH